MADELPKAGVNLAAENADKFQQDLNKSADSVGIFEKAVDSASAGINVAGEIFTGALRKVGELAVDVFSRAATAVFDYAKDSFAGALEAQQGLAALENTIESTGGAAGVTMERAAELADEFKNLFKGSDDVVLAVQEMALRVGTISNEEMPQFIERTADLAAVMKTDATSAARLLARAYEDPLGVTGKLRAAGVLLTDAQEEQIKKMVEAGDVAGASALLMDKLAEVTGGRAATEAATLAGQWTIFQETIADAGEGVALQLLPVLTELGADVLPVVAGAISDTIGVVGELASALISGDIDGAIDTLYENFKGLFSSDIDAALFFQGISDGISGVTEFVQSNLPLVQETFGSVFGDVMSVLDSVGGLIFNTLLPAIGRIFGDSSAQLPSAQQVFESVMSAISGAINIAADFIVNYFVPAIETGVAWVEDNWPTIEAVVTDVMNGIDQVITTVLSAINSFWNEWGDEITGASERFFDFWLTIFDAFSAAFEGDWREFGSILRDAFDQAWQNLQDIVTAGIDWFLSQDWGQIGDDIIAGIAQAISSGASRLADAAIAAASAALEALKGFLDIDSPSGVYEREIGDPSVEGALKPFKTRQAEFADTAVDFVSAGLFAMPPVIGRAQQTNNSAYTYSPTYYTPNTPSADSQLVKLFWSA